MRCTLKCPTLISDAILIISFVLFSLNYFFLLKHTSTFSSINSFLLISTQFILVCTFELISGFFFSLNIETNFFESQNLNIKKYKNFKRRKHSTPTTCGIRSVQFDLKLWNATLKYVLNKDNRTGYRILCIL